MTWPFENDTSAITKKLAQRSFKANKLRNIVAVIAIVLTSMLFTSVTTLCVGAIQSIQTTILQIRGTSPSTGTSVNWIAIIAALFFIMIFVITGYLLIRNIFEISVVQEIKKYGLLRTIGTTEKQIKRIVYKQAFWLSIIAISIGLILGYIPLSLIVANTILPTFFNQPDLWLFTIQPTIFPLILEGIVICVVAIIVPHVSFRYFRKTSIVARLRVVE